jgi:DNA-binding MarR family transcriptional regulator
MQEFSRWMAACGLSKSQIGTLMLLHYHGHCPVSGISDELGITAAAASQLVDRLVQMSLLERSEDPDDRRVRRVSLSERGHELIQKGVEVRLGWMKELADTLTSAEQAGIVSALETLIQAAKQSENNPSRASVRQGVTQNA